MDLGTDQAEYSMADTTQSCANSPQKVHITTSEVLLWWNSIRSLIAGTGAKWHLLGTQNYLQEKKLQKKNLQKKKLGHECSFPVNIHDHVLFSFSPVHFPPCRLFSGHGMKHRMGRKIKVWKKWYICCSSSVLCIHGEFEEYSAVLSSITQGSYVSLNEWEVATVFCELWQEGLEKVFWNSYLSLLQHTN